jgi:hypothetical protein
MADTLTPGPPSGTGCAPRLSFRRSASHRRAAAFGTILQAIGPGIATLTGCALALAGCALPGRPVANLTASDLANAQAIAKAGGDSQGALCWGNLLPAVQAFQAGPSTGSGQTAGSGPMALTSSAAAGASLLEIYRVAVIQAGGACAPIVLPIIAKLGPLLPAIGALAVTGPVIVP